MSSAARKIGFAALLTVLIAGAALSVPGCGGKEPTRKQSIERYSQELREAVSSHVVDEQRRAQMLVVVDQVEALHHRFSQETEDFLASYRQLNADYDSSRPAFDQLFSDYAAKRIRARNDALDLHFRLASLATTAEWDSIGEAETDLYEEVNEARPPNESAK